MPHAGSDEEAGTWKAAADVTRSLDLDAIIASVSEPDHTFHAAMAAPYINGASVSPEGYKRLSFFEDRRISEFAAPVHAPLWLPIETAPKDGEWVDLFVPDLIAPETQGDRQIMCRWQRRHEFGIFDWQQFNNGGFGWVSGNPTHWSPIPTRFAPTKGTDK